MLFSRFESIPEARCPLCSARFDERLAPIEGEYHRPRPGDLTACPYCASLLVLSPDLTPQPTTREQVIAAPVEVQKQLMREQVKIFGRRAMARAAGVGLN